MALQVAPAGKSETAQSATDALVEVPRPADCGTNSTDTACPRESHEAAYDVPLFQGRNTVRVVAKNEGGESQPVTVEVFHNGDGALDQRGTLWILAVGVDDYPYLKTCLSLQQRPISCNLNFAGADAKDFAATARFAAAPAESRPPNTARARERSSWYGLDEVSLRARQFWAGRSSPVSLSFGSIIKRHLAIFLPLEETGWLVSGVYGSPLVSSVAQRLHTSSTLRPATRSRFPLPLRANVP